MSFYTRRMAPLTTATVPAMTGRLNASSFRFNKKDNANKNTGVVESSGVTTLAGERFRAMKRNILAIPANRPTMQYKPMILQGSCEKEFLLSRFNSEKLNATDAAKNEIKAPATGASVS